jgi:hypothetical protein
MAATTIILNSTDSTDCQFEPRENWIIICDDRTGDGGIDRLLSPRKETRFVVEFTAREQCKHVEWLFDPSKEKKESRSGWKKQPTIGMTSSSLKRKFLNHRRNCER